MDEYLFVRLLIYLLYVTHSYSDNFLFVQKSLNGFNLTCVGDSNSTLTWNGKSYDYRPPVNLYKNSNIKTRHSYNFNLPPVLDWRWKDFRLESCKCGSEQLVITDIADVKVLPISIRFNGIIKLKLNDFYELVLSENTTLATFTEYGRIQKYNCGSLDAKTPWRHFNLYSSEGLYFVSKTIETPVAKFRLNSLGIEAFGSDVEFKVHNYPVASLSKFVMQSEVEMCRSVFYYTQRTCTININSETIHTHNMNFWKESNFISNNLQFFSQYQIVVDVRQCNYDRNDMINTRSNVVFGCQDIKRDVSIAASVPTFVSKNDVCKTHEELCRNRLVCKNDGCFCLEKYSGTFCEKDKSEAIRLSCKGRWGSNCQYQCGQNCHRGCDRSTGICTGGCVKKFYGIGCDLNCPKHCKFDFCKQIEGDCKMGCLPNFEGPKCDKCKYGRWGENCENICGKGCTENHCRYSDGFCECRNGYDQESKCEVYRYLHETPIFNSHGPTWISLKINTSELDENASINFFDKTKKCTVTNSQDLYNITNLQPGRKYDFEIVVCNKLSCEVENALNKRATFTTCSELNTTTISFKTYPKSININYSKQGFFCQPYKLHYKSKHQKSANSAELVLKPEIKGLTPFTDYEIEITKNDERVYKNTIRTAESLSSEPMNLKWNDEENLIEWSKPLNPNGIIRAFNIYVNNSRVDQMDFSEGQDFFKYKLDLTPAEIYKINVQAVNSHEGEKAEIIIYTKPPTPTILINTTSGICELCTINVTIENKFNSTIYEILNSSNDNSCDGNIVKKEKLQDSDTITLMEVHMNATICVENNFFGRLSIAKIQISEDISMMKEASALSNLYYLIALPVVAVLIIILVATLRFRNKSKTKSYKVVSEPDEAELTLIPKRNSFDDIDRSQLEHYLKNVIYREMGASHFDIEYMNIGNDVAKEKTTIGKLSSNSFKNRYKNVIPYDSTRVILNDGPEDYINASYIPGYNGDRTYIATQCPKMITQNDFWWMVWQEDVKIIVMLSTLSEGLHKMTCYWPQDNATLDYRILKVRHVETVHRTDFVARTFVISFSGHDRNVVQINYTTWPDHNIPLFALSLIDFIKYVQILRGNHKSPMIVHCSAGLGRTGVYIMCDHYFNTSEKSINIPEKLQSLRKCRASLVQSNIQYRLVYFILGEILSMDAAKDISLDVIEAIDENTIAEFVGNDKHYINERLYLNNLLYKNIKLPNEYHKANRNPRIGAVSESRITITSKSKQWTYINAVYVHGYGQENKYISTQIPLADTVEDFWGMIYDESSEIIVVLHNVNSIDKSIFQFWPNTSVIQSKLSNSLQLSCMSEDDDVYYKVYNLEIKHSKSEVTQKIKLFAFKAWNTEKSVPDSVDSFLALYNSVSALEQRSKITLCCMDSAFGCGLYVAFDLLFNKIKHDNVFNICWAIRSIKRFRNDFVSCDDQLVFLYEMAKHCISKEVVSNIVKSDFDDLLNLIEDLQNR